MNFYGDDTDSKLRSKICIKFLENTRDLGIQCVVSDAGSNQDFLEKLHGFENVTVVESKQGMGKDRRKRLTQFRQIVLEILGRNN